MYIYLAELEHFTTSSGSVTAYFALRVQQLHTLSTGGMFYGVVFAFLFITQGVERSG